jgi:hypothetical protein
LSAYFEFIAFQRLGQNVCDHLLCLDVFHVNIPFLNVVANEVIPDIDVFASVVVDRIPGESDTALVVYPKRGRFVALVDTKLTKVRARPDDFLCSFRCGDVFCF